ncbi:MAG: hypothetical protein V4443_01005 [Pseudomonadota bacterium]
MKYRILIAALLSLIPLLTYADGLAVTGRLGSTGGGVELSKLYSEKFTGRIGFNTFNYNTGLTRNNINYDFHLKLQTATALADWYPYAGIFRVSGGLILNRNRVDLNAQPNSGNTYTINGRVYTSGSEAQSLNGGVRFNLIAPYIGIGWGNPVEKQKKWGLVSDIGLMLQGAPKTNLDVTCAPGYSGCASLQNDTAAERSKLDSSVSNFKLLPVLTIGASYQF